MFPMVPIGRCCMAIVMVMVLTQLPASTSQLTATAQQLRSCSVQGNSSAIIAVTELKCQVNNSIRYFKVTVSGSGADEVYTSILSPSNAACTGTGSSFICSALPGFVVAYNVCVGSGCLPNAANNNFADGSARFSKHIVVCKPCPPKVYWIGLQMLSPDMPCNFRLSIPIISTAPGVDARCAINVSSDARMPASASACAAGLQRTENIPAMCTAAGYACLFGICRQWMWLGVAVGAGMVPSMAVAGLLFSCGYGLHSKIHAQEAAADPMLEQPGGTGPEPDSDNEEVVPDKPPPSFFLRED